MIRALRALVLFSVAVVLLTLAAFHLDGSQLALPAALAGFGSFGLALS